MKSYSEYIGHYKNIVDSKLCDSITTYSQKSYTFTPSMYATSTGTSARSSERVSMMDCWIKSTDKYYEEIKLCYADVIKNYQEEHKDFKCERHTDFRLNKYGPGGFMSRHIDNIHHSHGQQYGHPQASILLFLNDDYKGGDLIIGDNNYNTKKGDAIMFPSNFMFPHEVLEVESGTRYSTITWVM
jgi:hypothetical protein